MSIVAEIQKAKEARPALAERRDELWAALDAHLAEMEPMKAKEREIRDQIKAVQGQMFEIDQLLGEARKAAR